MTAHAKLGASNSGRWMTCPGSVVLEEGLPDREGPHARLGSAAHALGETCLLTGDAPFEYLDDEHPVLEFADVAVDDDMVNAVTVYVEHCREILPAPQEHHVERKVALGKLGPWAGGMFGTADFVAVIDGTLYVRDYKHGQGVVVEAEGNTQFQYYALGALLDLHRPHEITTVDTGVVQPRAPHSGGPIRTATYSPEELYSWGRETLYRAVMRVRQARADWAKVEDDAGAEAWETLHLAPSEGACKFCKAKATCPALKRKVMDEAMLEFDQDGVIQPQRKLNELKPEEVSRILEAEKMVKDYFAAVATLAQESLLRGDDITGGRYKLVAGRATRKWSSEDIAATRLAELGFEDDDIYSRKLVTPAQAEKLVGTKGRDALKELVVREEGKPTLAPADDKRQALDVGPDADFAE